MVCAYGVVKKQRALLENGKVLERNYPCKLSTERAMKKYKHDINSGSLKS